MRNDELSVVNEVLRQKAVQQVNAALVIDLLARHVRRADLIVDRAARAADRRGDVIARFQIAHVGANCFDNAKRFVPQDQKAEARRRHPYFASLISRSVASTPIRNTRTSTPAPRARLPIAGAATRPGERCLACPAIRPRLS